MNKAVKIRCQEDIFRYYGKFNLSLKEKIIMPVEVKYMRLWRKTNMASQKITKLILKWRLNRMSQKSHIQISANAKIGRGFYIGHLGHIIINPQVQIGDNCNIAAGVTLGQENRGTRRGAPTIGSEVWIGTNAVIVGKINIGDDVLIAPNAFVNFDVPSHSVVIGNPGRAVAKKDATKSYIENIV